MKESVKQFSLVLALVTGYFFLFSESIVAQTVLANGATNASASGKTIQASIGQSFIGLRGASGKNIGSGYWYQLSTAAISTDLETTDELAKEFSLHGNYPNPFNPSTTIAFDLAKQAKVKLVIYDLLGNKIETLVDTELTSGRYRKTWEATGLTSGTYFYRIDAGDWSATKRMTLLK